MSLVAAWNEAIERVGERPQSREVTMHGLSELLGHAQHAEADELGLNLVKMVKRDELEYDDAVYGAFILGLVTGWVARES